MPRRRNTPGGPAAFAAYTNGPGAAPPPPPPRPSKAKAAAAYASRFVKSPDNWWLLLLLASAALWGYRSRSRPASCSALLFCLSLDVALRS